MITTMLSALQTDGLSANLLEANQSNQLGQVEIILSILISSVTLLSLLWQLWKRVINPYMVYKKRVDFYYTRSIRKAISKYYIPTRAQDIDPCDHEEIRENNGKYLSQLLVPFFCKRAFARSSFGKYYLVLADSGMGKSTFLLRLYRQYLFRFSFGKKPVELVPLAYKNCIKTINAIQNKENTILLLDALDENPDAIKNYEYFFQELLGATEKFYKIVITCRTQFFPSNEKEPSCTGFIRAGMGKKADEITKKYLSPFSDDEVKRYLRKHYRFNKKMRNKAFSIVQKVPSLMARPVILNWMDFLCDASQEYDYTFLIYTTILDKWIERERLSGSSEKLREFSIAIAEYMFENRATSMPASKVEQIASLNGIEIEPIIAKSRSLLNRNSAGEYKFAHRSFLEYLMVYSVFTKQYSLETMKYIFTSSGTKRFLFEILLHSATLKYYWDSIGRRTWSEDVQSMLNTSKLLDVLLGNDIDLFVRHNTNGFIITCRTYMLKSELWKPELVKHISKNVFFVGAYMHHDGIAEFKFDFVVNMKNDRNSIFLTLECENESPVR